jgi:hypothetical protein
MAAPRCRRGTTPTQKQKKDMTFALLIYRIEKGALVIEQTISGFESRQAAKEWADLIEGDAEWADLIEGEAQYSIIEID